MLGCNFRKKVAFLSNPEFGEHYAELNDTMFLMEDERVKFLKKYNKKTKELIKEKVVSIETANL